MVKQINEKYLKQADEILKDKHHNNNKYGDVMIEYGEFLPEFETQIVKEPVPVIGKIFPFIKRKVKKQVATGRKDLIIQKSPVWKLRQQGESVSPSAKGELERVPYTRIIPLDSENYGSEIYLAQCVKNVNEHTSYEILSKEGFVIGKFIPTGYYAPSLDDNHLPEDVNLDDAIAHYCAKNPDTIKHIPEQIFEKKPDLAQKLEQQISQELDAESTKTAKPTLTKE